MGLQYDNTGFSYFLLASLSLYLLPSYLYVFRSVGAYYRSFKEGGKARTREEGEKVRRERSRDPRGD